MTFDFSKLWSISTGESIPLCMCGKQVGFETRKRFWRKFCGMKCHSVSLSRKNTANNAEMMRRRKINLEHSLKDEVDKAVSEYLNTDKTIAEVSTGLSQWRVRRELGSIESKQSQRRRSNIQKQFKTFFDDISDDKMQKKIREKWTCKTFAKFYRCSANFVAVKFREAGIKIPRGISSREEIDFGNLIAKTFDVKIERNNRKIISPKEIDIWIPSHNLGIEYHGSYWHQDDYPHLVKQLLAQEKNFTLLQFFDYEVKSNIAEVLNKIKQAMKVDTCQ